MIYTWRDDLRVVLSVKWHTNVAYVGRHGGRPSITVSLLLNLCDKRAAAANALKITFAHELFQRLSNRMVMTPHSIAQLLRRKQPRTGHQSPGLNLPTYLICDIRIFVILLFHTIPYFVRPLRTTRC